jgi:hypothetical protein
MKLTLPWESGRQRSGYQKLKLWSFGFSDCYLLKYPQGSKIPPHVDAVDGRKHYRLNIVLKRARKGGRFICSRLLFKLGGRVYLFRPDVEKHSITEILEGSRYVLSFGVALK